MRIGRGAALTAVVAALGCSQREVVAPDTPLAASIQVAPWHAVVAVGERISARADARTAQGSRASGAVEWRSSAPTVALVTSSGEITAAGLGTATITATVDTVTASLIVEVEPRGLRRIVDSVRRAYDLPAMGAAVVTTTGTEALAVAGTRRATGGPLVTTADKWHIGSNLKAITAALAAIAVDRGKLTWSTTVAAAFPDLAATIRPEHAGVTLADLLSHRGGIRNDPPLGAFIGTDAKQQRASLVAWALSSPPAGPIGVFAYSNLGYVVAGAMIERAWNGVFEDLLVSELLAPLGAVGLGWGPPAAVGASDQPAAHALQGGRWVVCEACDNPPGLSAAGRAHLPLDDWARLIRELLLADAGQSTLISPAAGRLLFTSQVPLQGTDGYGLGWILVTRSWAGGRAAGHDGSNTVNHSVAWLGLGRGTGFIAVTNAADLAGGTTARALDALIGRMITFHETAQ